MRKRLFAVLSDLCSLFGLHKSSMLFLMMSLETEKIDYVCVNLTMTPRKSVLEPLVIFEDKQAIAELGGRAYSEIAIVQTAFDVN